MQPGRLQNHPNVQHHLLATSLLGKHRHTCTTAASGLGMLALHLEAPVVTKTPAQTKSPSAPGAACRKGSYKAAPT